MRKKIKNSLSVKVFLWVFSALTFCSMLIYGIVLTVLPRQYQAASDKRLDSNIEALVVTLEKMRYEEAVDEIYNFCIQNNSAAVLNGEKGALSFGEIEKTEDLTAMVSSVAVAVTLEGGDTEYMLVISSLSQTADAILILMLRFLPAVLATILLLSFVSAFICSRAIVGPIAKISQISRRMTSLDMTWKCDIKSNDEIGVLASSLNTMANRLQKTMEELKDANRQLTVDVEKFKMLEEEKRNFFAAVSHELKTPLTILKGQIENMIWGYGDYQNHEKYLPEALKSAEDIERLVREIIAISKMESMDLQGSLQEISLRRLTEDAVRAILPLAREKQMQICTSIDTDPLLSVNPGLFQKALSNILGNAVRHSPCGEKIFIFLQSGQNGDALVIENTGAWIPKDDLPHLFTPFYRTDKSRAKATGGSGLGLYIVKTILDLHHMAYGIENTKRGMAFFLYLNE